MSDHDTIVVLDDSLFTDEFGGGAYIFNRNVILRFLRYYNVIYIPKLRNIIDQRYTRALRDSVVNGLLSLRSSGFQVPDVIMNYFKKGGRLKLSRYVKILKTMDFQNFIIYDNNFFPEFSARTITAQLRSLFFPGEMRFIRGKKKIALIQALGDRDLGTIMRDTFTFMYTYRFFSIAFLLMNMYRKVKNVITRSAVINNFDLVILTNEATKRFMGITDPSNFKIIKYGMANDWSPIPTHMHKGEYIFFNARLGIFKGIIDLLYVFKEISKIKNIKLLIAGSFEDNLSRIIFMRKMKELKLQDRIEILGFVSDEKLKELFSQIRVFLYPSHSDTYSISMIRAIQFRVPVVAFDLVTLKFIYSGIPIVKFVAEFDYRKMAEEVLNILDMDEIEYNKLCYNPETDQFISKHSSWENVAEEVTEILRNEFITKEEQECNH